MSLIKEELQTSKKNLTQRRIVTKDIDLDDLKNGEIPELWDGKAAIRISDILATI